MSALDAAKADNKITDTLIAAARPYFAKAVWAMFDAEKDTVLFSKWGFIRIRVGDLEGLFAAIAGPRPAAA